MSNSEPEIHETSKPVTAASDQPWSRLSSRMIWVDLAQTILAASPLIVALLIFNVEQNLWPLIILAIAGTWGAAQDAIRWVFTRYRITDNYVELRTGIITRSYRSVKRDRIRSVDIEARLRHRLAGIRIIQIGAGQQAAADEAAFTIDAVEKTHAEGLRRLLQQTHIAAEKRTDTKEDKEVFARLKPWWVMYNIFNIWLFAVAAGLLYGVYSLLEIFAISGSTLVTDYINQQGLSLEWLIVAGFALVVILGAIGMAVVFFTEYWGFELARVRGQKGTQLRTKQGLFTTREVSREDSRMRGIDVSQPLFWRWMKMTDTNIITTGLSTSSMSQPTAILPRGPRGVAEKVAGKVLGEEANLFKISLTAHPLAALRRRLLWATGVAASVVLVVAWLVWNEAVPAQALWIGAAVWILALLAAVIAYRALGHVISGRYFIVRSGLLNRSTSVLQRTAVCTVAIRQSPLQWRLGLKTATMMTAAGWQAYESVDMDQQEAIVFADEASAGLLEPFLIESKE